MTTFQMTDSQVLSSVAGARVETAVSRAVAKADELAEKSGCNMTVVRTKNYGICVWADFKMLVAKDEITEVVYSSDDGFKFSVAA